MRKQKHNKNMKKLLYMAFLPMMMLMMTLTSCSKDDNSPIDGFDYPAETLYGTWKITKVGGISWLYETTTATFNSDGSYSGKGYFGNGTGTYTAKGKTINCYVSGKLYCTYEVQSLSGTTAVLKMFSDDNSSTSLTLTCEKQ